MDNNRSQLFYTALGYILLGVIVALCGVVLVVVLLWCVHHVSRDTLQKGVLFVFGVSTVFGWLIKEHRELWRKSVFWGTLGALLVAHVVCALVVFRTAGRWSVALTLVSVPVEVFLFLVALDWSRGYFGRHRRRRPIAVRRAAKPD
jgi:hypothetical protein